MATKTTLPGDQNDRIQGGYNRGFDPTPPTEREIADGIQDAEDYAQGDGGDDGEDSVGPEDLQSQEAGGFYKPGGDSSDGGGRGDSNKTKDSLEKASVYNEAGDENQGRLGRARNKVNSLKVSAGKNKLLVGGVVAGSGTVAGFLLLLILVAGALKIPHLAANITAYQFARLSRQYATSAERVTAEKAALDAIPETAVDDSTWKKVKEKYTGPETKAGKAWSKLDKYRPNIAADNLKTKNGLRFDYKTSRFGTRQILTGVSINGKEFAKVKPGLGRFVPGLNSVLDFKNNLKLSNQIGPEIQASLRVNEVNPLIRGTVAKELRQKLGIGLVAWKLGSYEGKSERQARIQNVRDTNEASSKKTVNADPVTDELKQGVQDAEQASAETLGSEKLLEETLTKGGVAPKVKAAISKVLVQTGFKTAVQAVSPIYAIALPVCIVFDGSIDRSSPTIDNQTQQQQAIYYFIASAADQEKNGSTPDNSTTELATAVQGLNDNLGDVSQSNAVTRASTGSVNTSSSASAEASAGGTFTLLDATPGFDTVIPILGVSVASIINKVGESSCPKLTSIKFAIGIAAAQVIAAFFSGGTSEEALGVASTVAEGATSKIATSLFSRLTTKAASSAVRTKELVFDVTKSTAAIVSTTVVAKYIVASRAAQLHHGTAQGKDLADIADSGGNITAGEICRHGFYCRPLAKGEIGESDVQDRKYLADLNQSKSVYDRYLSPNNVASLVSKEALALSGSIHGSVLQSTMRLAGQLFRPFSSFGSLFNMFGGIAHAETPTETTYGNVQFGWTKAEETLIDSSDSFKLLENQYQLDQAKDKDGNSIEDKIDGHYGKCFKDTLGNLLSAGDIRRDKDGDLVDQGLCSPSNLGPNNTEDCGSRFGRLGDHYPCGDLVFRWRLAHRYNTVLNQLGGLSDAKPL
jgi:hypothetical protein